VAGAVRWLAVFAVVYTALSTAHADPIKLRVGTPAGNNFTFLPLRVGIERGFFAKYGLDIEAVDFQGGSKLQQAMVAGALDMAVSGGTDIAYIAKGAPELTVAAMAGPPLLLGVVVPYDSPAKSAEDLKGKTIGITTVGSLTEWLMRRLVQQKGWRAEDLTLIPVGSDGQSQIAALTTGQVDGVVAPAGLGFQLELVKRGRLLFPCSDIVQEFLGDAIFASNQLIRANPDAVKRFLAAWFENIAWMRQNRIATVEIIRAYTKFDPEVESREYDQVMPMFSANGKFEPGAMKTLQESFVDMGLIDANLDLAGFYTEAYLPEK
jgi:NitT/TauT family transport system substrate-binding protein